MAFDIILTTDSKGSPEKLIPVSLEASDSILEKIENIEGFELIRKVFADYYGQDEIYLNNLENLRAEVLVLKELFQSDSLQRVNDFLIDFLSLIEYAITSRRTIKFVGD